ncbi:MAG: hypothetical protein ACI33M_02470 [Lysinibacillus sp.]
MRTSRVSGAVGSTYRNTKRFSDTEQAFTIMNDGHSLEHFNHQQQQRHNKKKKAPAKKTTLVNKRQHILIKGIQFDADSVTTMRNQLLRQALNVSYVSKMKRRNHTYRTSI